MLKVLLFFWFFFLRSSMVAVARTIEYERPWLYPVQEKAIFHPARIVVIEASTKSGKTVGCLAWLLEQAVLGSSGQNFWWVAPVYAQAAIAYNRLKRGLDKSLYTYNETHLRISLINGTHIWFKSADNVDNLYGEDVYACVVDEATRTKKETWPALRSTLTATRGPIRIVGNAKGRKNWVYQLGVKAKAGTDRMHYARITAYDAVAGGVLDAQEIEDAKEDLPKEIFEELYLAIPTEDGGNPFGIKAIRACVAPMSSLEPASFGVDLAKYQDWSVILGLDDHGYTCHLDRFRLPWKETISRVESSVGSTQTLVDSTGVGDPVVELMQRGDGKVEDEDDYIPSRDNIEGFKFTQQSKQQLLEGLAVGIQRSNVHFPDGWLVDELESMEYSYSRTGVTYRVPEGMNDDGVMSLALAYKKLKSGVRMLADQFSSGGKSQARGMKW